MTAILIPLSIKFGMQGVLAAGAVAGLFLLAAGLLRMGKLVYYIPVPVIAGFTSGIAVIIALGQAENLLGVLSHGTDTLERFFSIFSGGFHPNYFSLTIGLTAIAIMLFWPAKLASALPGSLAAVIISTVFAFIFQMPVALVGEIPRTLLHGSRLTIPALLSLSPDMFLMPAFSIAALGMIESLLCGVAGGRMKGEKLNGDRELIAQGIGNILLPFLGGVPATAAIARTSVAIKSGCKTRISGMIQGAVLLLSMFAFSPLMSRVPLPALAGVLTVTAWRMNEWHLIRYIFGKGFRYGAAKFLITMAVTVVFDLTVAIAAGVIFAMVVFVSSVSDLLIEISEIDPGRLRGLSAPERHTQIIYVTGPLFFGSVESFENGIALASGGIMIISLRGVSYIDTSGVQALHKFCERKIADGASILFTGVNPRVRRMIERAEITRLTGEKCFFDNPFDALASLA